MRLVAVTAFGLGMVYTSALEIGKTPVTPLTISVTHDILASSNRCSMTGAPTLRPAVRAQAG